MQEFNLKDFQYILETRQKEILQELQGNTANICNLHNSEPRDEVDMQQISNSSHIDFKINENLKKELDEIKISLNKIKNNTYGICEYCEEIIHLERLKIKPHAKYCINCRKNLEKRKEI
ncbi:RNA polymerase-binding protein DksA [Campylobacter insulaenigrae]|uniref:DnaK suppressor protein n=1 Tax=Campylobacter insulaenigrae NCTC 12927 TaxID=1031564 RepID=A0A0A8GZL0_9BACT|nr:RNA polymerase-binding protein DksA [Campylobacter insulaenigrae]AJC87206.1 DnaK suppressor protein [Campylobacter insulaenigrae NCTC 12927]VEH93041.1 DksA-like protein [Campylobacter insulaenigrae]